MQQETSIGLNLTLFSLLVVIAVIWGVARALRQGDGKVVLALGGLVLLAGFFVTSAKSVRVDVPAQLAVEGAPHVQGTSYAEKTPESIPGVVPSKIQHITASGEPFDVSELPNWRQSPGHQGEMPNEDSTSALISQRYATVDEAEVELFQRLTVQVQRELPNFSPATRGWMPTRQDLQSSGLISEKVIETLPLKVGEFENAVYRVSWLIDWNPKTRQALLTRWEPMEAERRARLVLGVLAGVSGLFGVSALALRRRKQAQESAAPSAGLMV